MSTRIQLRRDTAAAWTTANPILTSAEVGVETDTGMFKVGDGVTAWTALDYVLSGVEGMVVHDGSAGGGTRPEGFFRVRWVSPTGSAHSRPTNMETADVWERDA